MDVDVDKEWEEVKEEEHRAVASTTLASVSFLLSIRTARFAPYPVGTWKRVVLVFVYIISVSKRNVQRDYLEEELFETEIPFCSRPFARRWMNGSGTHPLSTPSGGGESLGRKYYRNAKWY